MVSALFLLPWAVALVKVRHHHLDSGAVGLAATFSLGLPALWLAVAGYLEGRRPDQASKLTLGPVADELAIAVGAQWEAEAQVRRLNDPYPLPVSWAAADASLTDSWPSLVRLASTGVGWPVAPPAGTWASAPDDLAGEGGELAAVLTRVPTGRLVVLGEPGSGKTVLMIRLVLDLLARRTGGEPVPFLASIAAWNPMEQDLRGWLGAQLLMDHPALANPGPTGGTESSQAASLLEARLILPILDGLDEIPEEIRRPAISRINDALRAGEQVVVTCRTQQYGDAVRPPDGIGVTLRAFAAVELHRLDAAAVRNYLLEDASGPTAEARWDPVLAVLGAEVPVGQALRTPLMVGLARVIYNPRPGELSGSLPEPRELLDRADRAAVEARLLDAFIPAAYRHDRDSRWNARDAEGWLVVLSRQLQDAIGSPDLAWWQLPRAVPGFMAAAGIVLGVALGTVGWVAGWVLGGYGIGRGIVSRIVTGILLAAAGVAVGVAAVKLRDSPGPVRGIRWQLPGPGDLLVGLAVIAFCGGFGVLDFSGVVPGTGPKSGLVAGLVDGSILGAVLGIFLWAFQQRGNPLDLSSALSPRGALAGDRKTGMALGAMAGAGVAAVITALAEVARKGGPGIGYGIAAGVMLGIACSFAVARWPSYGIARIWLALHHQLPWSLGDFLADAHRRGVLRQAGAVYQFRHIELQHRLASRPAAAAPERE